MGARIAQAAERPGSRLFAKVFASLGFLVLIVGITYFAMLVFAVEFGHGADRAASYYELARFLSGRLEWYRDARVYGAVSLLCALVSVLFGVHPLARITLPVAGSAFVVLHIWGESIWRMITTWARR